MKFIKLLLAILGLIFGVMLFFWLFGLVTSLIWYGLVFGVIAAIGYSGYKLFRKAEDKFVGPAKTDYLDSRDFDTSWDEYKQKYLTK
ncbi:MAG: hypothetical protein IT173_02025 [Acidobacteria bacterium]|nr:hypothetical protein [Acidobacteriota bacterium]